MRTGLERFNFRSGGWNCSSERARIFGPKPANHPGSKELPCRGTEKNGFEGIPILCQLYPFSRSGFSGFEGDQLYTCCNDINDTLLSINEYDPTCFNDKGELKLSFGQKKHVIIKALEDR